MSVSHLIIKKRLGFTLHNQDIVYNTSHIKMKRQLTAPVEKLVVMSCSGYFDGMGFGNSVSQIVCCAICCFILLRQCFPSLAEYSECVLLAIPHLLINRRPHNRRHTHKHSPRTAAILWDLWSVYSLFPGQRFLLTCKNSGDVFFWKKKKKSLS